MISTNISSNLTTNTARSIQSSVASGLRLKWERSYLSRSIRHTLCWLQISHLETVIPALFRYSTLSTGLFNWIKRNFMLFLPSCKRITREGSQTEEATHSVYLQTRITQEQKRCKIWRATWRMAAMFSQDRSHLGIISFGRCCRESPPAKPRAVRSNRGVLKCRYAADHRR